ncbi:MAG: hypothetical protein ACI8P0_001879 [Planctomycetaceae bacterium]|jgi:hypothetical protein
MPYTAPIADKLAVVRSMFAERVPGSHGGAREYVVTDLHNRGRTLGLAPSIPNSWPTTKTCPAISTSLRVDGARDRMPHSSARDMRHWC